MNTNDETLNLQNQIARLEFANDQLFTEIKYLDELLRLIGFSDGLASIKAAANEILQQEAEDS